MYGEGQGESQCVGYEKTLPMGLAQQKSGGFLSVCIKIPSRQILHRLKNGSGREKSSSISPFRPEQFCKRVANCMTTCATSLAHEIIVELLVRFILIWIVLGFAYLVFNSVSHARSLASCLWEDQSVAVNTLIKFSLRRGM